jgi:sugar/nucleoside kinase (ribokinase family)
MPKGAMSLVDAAQSARIYDTLTNPIERSGGSAANTIAALGALGREAAFIGKRRDDAFGDVFASDIRATGAEFGTIAATSGEETARCVIMVTPDAERTMATYLGISGDLMPEDVDAETVGGSAILYLEGYLWDKPHAKDAFRRAMTLAHDAGRRVALTLSDPFCVDRHRDSFREIVREETDILFANEAEILSLYETDDFDAAVAMAKADVAIAAITRSEKGAVIVSASERIDVPAEEISTLVDTTGAGDLFAAGFLNGIVTNQPLQVCGEMGCAAASVVIQLLGARCPDALRAKFAIKGWT